MKKILLFFALTFFLTNCKPIEFGDDCSKKPLNKITVTGKVVYEDDSQVEQCYVYINESKLLGFYSKRMADTIADQSGEFTLVFTPRQQDEKNWCEVNYSVKCEKEGYYQKSSSVYAVSKYKSKQSFNVILIKIKE